MPEHINLLDKNEMLKLLRGQYPVRRVIRSQFDHEPMNLPTEPSVVLGDYIYETPCCQCVFQDALKVLLSGSADDVFLGFAYIEECLLDEKLGLAAFHIDTAMLVPLLTQAVWSGSELSAALMKKNTDSHSWMNKKSPHH